MLVWISLLGVLTVGGAIWLTAAGGSYRDFSTAILVIAYAPSIAALVVVGFQRGGVRALLAQLLRWRAGARWYAIALLGPLLLILAASAFVVALGVAAPATWLVLPSAAVAPALLGPIVAGSLGEELGWRGFAQGNLQRRLAAVSAAVVVGLIWSLWHLWPALTPLGRAELTVTDVVSTFVRLVSTAVIYAWLYNSTDGALPVVLVAHAAHNTAISLMPVEIIGADAGAPAVALLYAVAAIVVIAGTSVRTLTRAGRPRGSGATSPSGRGGR